MQVLDPKLKTWKLRTVSGLAAVWVAAYLAGCGPGAPAGPAPAVAVSNPYLESAVREFLGPAAPVLNLAGPGSCPGHFDLRPGQARALARCQLLLRFDFQAALDDRLDGARAQGLRIAGMPAPNGLCLPASYLAVCRQTAAALTAAGQLPPPVAQEKLRRLEARLAENAATVRRRLAPLKEAPVLAGPHQRAFCGWLGLRVAGVFDGTDAASPAAVNQVMQLGRRAGVRFVVANRPEGRQLADALAGHLGARVVVFDNFPAAATGAPAGYDALLADNVDALLRAAAP
jgi:zinc transport system substrate-binding protein